MARKGKSSGFFLLTVKEARRGSGSPPGEDMFPRREDVPRCVRRDSPRDYSKSFLNSSMNSFLSLNFR